MKFQKIEYPKDEIKHKDTAEWWYFNGFLETKDKKQKFAYMHTLFRTNLKYNYLLKLIPFHNKIFKDYYFSHSLLLNLKTKEMVTDIKHHVKPTKDSFKDLLLSFEYEDCKLKEKHMFEYDLKNKFLELNLKSNKKPLLENKLGIIKNSKNYTYYYSLTNLESKGNIKWKNKLVTVKGKSWHDHQWMNNMQPNVKWDWFSIMLENNTEIVISKLNFSNNKKWNIYATMIDNKGKQKTCHKIIFKENKTIELNKVKYPIEWTIQIPDWNIKLNIIAISKKQQMNIFPLKYWEGPTNIICKVKDNKTIKGQGFLEMVH